MFFLIWKVISGDTDSLMDRFGVSMVAEVIKLDEEAAGKVNNTFFKPIKLGFNKGT